MKISIFAWIVILILCLPAMGKGTEVGSTRENPVPLGTSADLGDGWQIKVLKVYPDAADMVNEETRKYFPG